MIKLNTKKFALAAGAVLALATSQAFAVPNGFTFDASGAGLKSGSTTFTANLLHGTSDELITFTPDGQQANATGYLSFQYATLGSTTVKFFGAAASTYGLYLTFNLTDHLISSNGTTGNTYALDSLTFNFYLDKNGDTTFSNADAVAANATPGAGTSGPNAATTSDDIKIASGTLNPGYSQNQATIGSAQNVSLTSSEFFNGNALYFTDPTPFYNLAFNAFENTAQTFIQAGRYGQVNGATGSVSFAVPEPTSLALFGIAAVGLGLSAKRRRKA